MENVHINGMEFVPYIKEDEIDRIIRDLAEQLNRDYQGKNPLFIVILNGAFIFAADLVKKITVNCQVSLIKLSSYSGTESTHNVCELIGLAEEISGRHVVILEDIVDTGISMEKTLESLSKKNPASLKICSLLFKPEKFQKTYKVDYIGKSIPNNFVIGYGFDLDGYARNLPMIYQLKAQEA